MTEHMTNPAKQAPEKMFPVRLLKNYQPNHDYEILGYNKPPVLQKNAIGVMVTVEEGGWVAGEMHPAPLPGTGYANKIWADTYVKLPMDVAKRMIAAKTAERADALPN